MPARLNSIAGHTRQRLAAGWEICSTPADSIAGPKELSQSSLQWLPAHAPSTVAACLRAAGSWSLDAPAQRFDAHDWWYRLRFTAPAPAPGEVLVLGFDGLATVAQVWLNGEPLLSSDNMFLAHECRLETLPPGEHELLLRFRALDRLLEAKRPRPKWRAPMVENQQLRWFRTTLLGRTPGWSPPAAAVGPWRAVWLERRTGLELTDLKLRTGLQGAQGWIEVSASLAPLGNHTIANVALVVTRGADRRHSIALHRLLTPTPTAAVSRFPTSPCGGRIPTASPPCTRLALPSAWRARAAKWRSVWVARAFAASLSTPAAAISPCT